MSYYLYKYSSHFSTNPQQLSKMQYVCRQHEVALIIILLFTHDTHLFADYADSYAASAAAAVCVCLCGTRQLHLLH